MACLEDRVLVAAEEVTGATVEVQEVAGGVAVVQEVAEIQEVAAVQEVIGGVAEVQETVEIQEVQETVEIQVVQEVAAVQEVTGGVDVPIVPCIPGVPDIPEIDSNKTTDRGRVPIETLIQCEIERRLKKKSWNQLDMCFKWRLVSTFLSENGMYDTMDDASRDELRVKIRKNELEGVEYDNSSMKILNMDTSHIIVAVAPASTRSI